jgi:hypothetical protein
MYSEYSIAIVLLQYINITQAHMPTFERGPAWTHTGWVCLSFVHREGGIDGGTLAVQPGQGLSGDLLVHRVSCTGSGSRDARSIFHWMTKLS